MLLDGGLAARATAEACYGAFHVVQALLATAGLAAETQSGVHTLLARHFVKDGPLPPGLPRRLSHLMADRLLADCGVDRWIDSAGGRAAARDAVGIIEAMLPVLRERAPEAGSAGATLASEVAALAATT